MSLPEFLLLSVLFVGLVAYALNRLYAYLETESKIMTAEVNRRIPEPLTKDRLYEICEWVKITQKPILKISRAELWALVDMAKTKAG